ncbi:class I SAM-dependent methyltransferase [Gordonia sp. ABSL1-1]|uniref:class I SAM-dependent methyltransferase n=1 Tax=Gordonia sp. ABSL1-1 TaxID=3053923 RepID=UPI002573FB7E|nr:class I SAM-dependent methyltransferase [Gordonia sp. ABSL1-1]MDL9936055.1 class I SAM-dependent methyltransferase [Gordonia sp. ABSL1-1]
MGFYDDRVLPHLIELTCGATMLTASRRRACAPLTGDVVEIGFGSGLNVALYPDAVTRVAAVEPSDVGWSMSEKRRAAATVPIDRAGLDGEHLPFDDHSFDGALSTFTMCTIPNLPAALAELRRVVKPGGVVGFLEHGAAPDESVARWQHRLEPIQRRVAGGCHLTRDTRAALTDAGFEVDEIDRFYQRGVPRPFGYLSVGVARSL